LTNTGEARASCQVADVRDLEGEVRYDLFVCSEVLYYLDRSEIARVADRLERMARPGARLAVVGRADDTLVIPALERHFVPLARAKGEDRWRPFAVSLLELR